MADLLPTSEDMIRLFIEEAEAEERHSGNNKIYLNSYGLDSNVFEYLLRITEAACVGVPFAEAEFAKIFFVLGWKVRDQYMRDGKRFGHST